MDFALFSLILGVLSIIYSGFAFFRVIREDEGNQKMREISHYIRRGADAFLRREMEAVLAATVVLAILILAAIGWQNALSFVVGSLSSAFAGYLGMQTSVRANVRTASRALKSGIKGAFDIAFTGGTIMGTFAIGIALIGISSLYMLFRTPLDIIGYMFGASLISLLVRVGGGIFTKGADIGADLVGKVEAGIPEDDPRNPGVIADNVGDNVGDCAGMGADLFETYAVTLITAMLLGYLLEPIREALGTMAVTLPLMIGGIAVIATIVSIPFVKLRNPKRIMGAFYNGLIISSIVAIALNAILIYGAGGLETAIVSKAGLMVSIIAGVLVMASMYAFAEYFTSGSYGPVKRIAQRSQTGPAINIISGISSGLFSSTFPVMIIAVAIIAVLLANGGLYYPSVGFYSGVYAVGIAATSMMSMAGMVISVDTFGPITDNAGGIAEMAGLPKEVRDNATDPLDAVGNTTKATTKAYAIASAGLAALSLFIAFVLELPPSELDSLQIFNPLVLVGLFIGAVVPFLFTSRLMEAVDYAAFSMVNEIRRQFREFGILEGKGNPDYEACVDIATRASLKKLLVPALIAAGLPLVVGFLLGPTALSGYMFGAIASGVPTAVWMTTGGAAWDNSKKVIESGLYGGKGSDAHKAAVVGDTVGDAVKDTAGPAVNPLIKVIMTVSVLFAPMIVLIHLL